MLERLSASRRTSRVGRWSSSVSCGSRQGRVRRGGGALRAGGVPAGGDRGAGAGCRGPRGLRGRVVARCRDCSAGLPGRQARLAAGRRAAGRRSSSRRACGHERRPRGSWRRVVGHRGADRERRRSRAAAVAAGAALGAGGGGRAAADRRGAPVQRGGAALRRGAHPAGPWRRRCWRRTRRGERRGGTWGWSDGGAVTTSAAGRGAGARPAPGRRGRGAGGRVGCRPGSGRCCGWWRRVGATRRSREALVISAHTVHRHVANILTKLDQTSRTGAVTCAMHGGAALTRQATEARGSGGGLMRRLPVWSWR